MPDKGKARKKPSAFDKFIVDVLKAEGGRAPASQEKREGGRTKFGIFEKAHPEVWEDGDVTLAEATQIYRLYYWDAVRGDEVNEISQKLALSMFDWAVNAGPQRAVIFLQRCLGVEPAIGKFARLTMKALQQCEDVDALVEKYNKMRDDYYANLVAKNAAKYGAYKNGWKNRMSTLRKRLGELNDR